MKCAFERCRDERWRWGAALISCLFALTYTLFAATGVRTNVVRLGAAESNPAGTRSTASQTALSAENMGTRLNAPLPGTLAVGKNADGHIEVFCVGADGAVRHRWQKAPSGDWASWSRLGGS